MGRIKDKSNWGIDDLVKEFEDRDYLVIMGAGKIAKRYGIARDIVYEARKRFRSKLREERSKKFPKILIFDLESAPLTAFVWSMWKQNIYNEQLISNFYLLSWSAKWLFDDKIMSDRLTGKEAKKQKDGRIVGTMRELIDQADIVVAHNIRNFDIPKLNARMIVNGYGPISPYQMIDTLAIARKEFGFVSNKLDALAEMFNFGSKIKTSFELWERCVNGEEAALEDMETYNKMDVELLEQVYLKLRPFMRSHPNIGLFLEKDESVCPYCGSDKISKNTKFYYTMVGKYESFTCERCGGVARGRATIYDKDKRKNLIVSIAR